MSSDGSSTNIALQPWLVPTKDSLTTADLYEQVHQLAEQRGHLRNVTEKVLQEEIDSGKDVTGDTMEGIEQEGQVEKKTETKEEVLITLATTREDMRRKLEHVRFAAQNALDLVALVLSQTPISNNETQFSQAIKDRRIPRASFGVQRAIEQPPTGANTGLIADEALRAHKHKLASRGARMMGLDSAADHLLRSATLLETEVRKETKYWEDILSLSQKGWSIRRQRKDQRHSPLIVEFGHPEASAQFNARGTAPLRMNKDGGIILDPTLRLRPKTLRVRIKVGDKVTGISCLSAQDSSSDHDIEHAVRFARTSLFEEELFHSINLESRHLLAYGIEQRDSVVHLPLPGSTKRIALIDCVPREDAIGSVGLPQDWLAHNIADALRLLMENEHRMRLNRRSRVPPPLAQQKRVHPDPPLLHSLLGILSHLYAVDSLRDYLNQVVRIFTSAGLDVKLEACRELMWESLSSVVAEPSKKGLSTVDQLLAAFIKPFEGKATLTLPSSNQTEQEQLTIATRTYFAPPTFGTEFKVTLPPSLASVLNLAQEQPRDFKMSAVDEVKTYLDWILSLDLSHTLLYKEYPKQAVLKSKDPRITILKGEGKKRFEQEVIVNLAGGKLAVTVVPSSPPVRTFTWDGRKGKASFKEELRSCLS
ncbi:subunit 17 of mediator complex-domain-containing protein [Dendryphion nanum]|uniref:Mediator of RNA polymerase II transcription subunit 17 n=1 Tax=Dendryphion nanum TaxID=256645 RepID=A0A9P9ELL7_9PLEO|nr:subunit 17 of mediator complex-domain-containing protein [Dendryphion nanum]